jgi:hypothetical protein
VMATWSRRPPVTRTGRREECGYAFTPMCDESLGQPTPVDEKSTVVMISSVLIRDFKTSRNVLTCTGKPTHSRILHR